MLYPFLLAIITCRTGIVFAFTYTSLNAHGCVATFDRGLMWTEDQETGRAESSLIRRKKETDEKERKKKCERERERGGRRNEEDKLRLSQLEATPCGIQLIKTTRPLFIKVIQTRSKKASRSGSVRPRDCHWRISARQIRPKEFAFACAKSVVRAGKKRSLKGIYK